MQRIHLTRLLLIMLLSLPVAYASALEKLRVGWVYAIANTPLLVASQQGYFQRNELVVELQRFDSEPELQQAIESGKLDAIYMDMGLVIQANQADQQLKIIAKVNYGQLGLVVGKSRNIKTLKDLKAKKLAGAHKASGMDVLLQQLVLKDLAQLTPYRDVNLIHMQPKLMDTAIDHRVVDAAFTHEPYVSQAILAGHADLLLDLQQIIPRYPWYVIAASKNARETKSRALTKLLTAHKQAISYLNSSESAANYLIRETFRIGRLVHYTGESMDADELVQQVRTRLGWQADFSQSDKQFLQRLINDSYALGYIKQKSSADEFIDLSFSSSGQ